MRGKYENLTSKIIGRISLNSIRWLLLLFILMDIPTLYSYKSDLTAPNEDDSFMVRLGKWKMRVAQAKCIVEIESLPRQNKGGMFCESVWDGWLCWSQTQAGKTANQFCPDYFPDFDTTEKAVKRCEPNGTWELTADKNDTLTNYSMCYAFTPEKMKHAFRLYNLAIVGNSVSLTVLICSMGIFMIFKSLSCHRVTMHKHMFMTYILNSIGVLVYLTLVVPNNEYVDSDPGSCKFLNCVNNYLMLCNYFWMLCEGIYLHRLLVVNVFNGGRTLKWYYLLGWGLPVLPTIGHAVARLKKFNDSCWMSMETYLVYIVHGPVMAALAINFFFMLNILFVLVKKIRNDGQHDALRYLKAVKAALILMPLLGIQFVIFPWRPQEKTLALVYDYVMHFLSHFQGFFVSMIYCFYNSSVQEVLGRRLQLFRTRWNERREGDALRKKHNNMLMAALSAAAAVTNADPGDDPVCICHRAPRNRAAANNQVGENDLEMSNNPGRKNNAAREVIRKADVHYVVEAEIEFRHGMEIRDILPMELFEQE